MCKNCVLVVSTPKLSKRDTMDYIQESKKEILSTGKTLPNGEEFKIDFAFIDRNGHVDYQSRKGCHIKRIVFDLAGHRDEGKIIGNIKKGLSRVNREENPFFMRVHAGDDSHGCKSIPKIKHSVCHFG